MKAIADMGYCPIDLSAPCSPEFLLVTVERPVVITFDDGYANFYEEALPILVEFGFPAVMYVVADFTSEPRNVLAGQRFMSWSELRELSKYGIRVGSHSLSHSKLYELPRSRVEDEIRHSKAVLEDKLGIDVDTFAYPYAFPEHDKEFVKFFRECLRMNGYSNAVTTILGTANTQKDPYLLPRLPVNTFDDKAFLRSKLEGGYEWLHSLQYAKKLCARRVVS
jgi:peptidoglycan/xylan/chitin deacetylase (PgdA/CDA1 family)